ncbi:MAG: RNA polymerase sigma factor [Planctomycetota bacterium]|jgi:RNA polymerase sigma-70 factor (ECF subfamily)
MPEDRHLVRQLQSGDMAALRRIYMKYKDDLMTVAVCLVLDITASEDVLHDVFVTLARDAAGRDIRRNLRGYLTTCVANRARDHLRRRARRNRLHPALPEGVAEAISQDREPPAALLGGADARAVCTALGALPREQREAIALHLHGAMTFRQIARHQGVGANTAKSRYRYGLEKLKSLLEQGVGP